MRWTRRPAGSNWGEFGLNDHIGRLNLLDPQAVLRGVAEVREGRLFCLSLPLDRPGGGGLTAHRLPPRLRSIVRKGEAYFHYRYSRENASWRDVVCDDHVELATQYSTQWDGLAHVGQEFDVDADGAAEIVYYNGWRPQPDLPSPEERKPFESVALGIDRAAVHGIQGRGVLVDLERHVGCKRVLVDGPMLRAILAEEAIAVERGDILCLRTGFSELLLEGQPDGETLSRSCAVLDGTCADLLEWISQSGIVAIAADNYAVEQVPARADRPCGVMLPLHEHCLFKLGIHLGELWHFAEMAKFLHEQRRYRFLLTAQPLRLPGAVGSPVTPLATA
jgi:hypothetical protein